MNGVMEMASAGERPHGGFGCGIDPERGRSNEREAAETPGWDGDCVKARNGYRDTRSVR